jgi:hypothetical protein
MTGAEFGAVLLAALSAGAAASLKETAADAVKSAYESLKARVSDLLGRVDHIDALADGGNEAANAVAAKITRKAEGTDENERATLGELIIQLKDVLEAHGEDASEISEQKISLIRTEIEETLFQSDAGGKQEIDIQDSKVKGSEFRSTGKKNL